METQEFVPFKKIARFEREWIATEKIDGTNASVLIGEDGKLQAVGSRNRWITPEADNHGFARYVHENKEMFEALGPGLHFGEWWGIGIGKRYKFAKGKKFTLFNTHRWSMLNAPAGIGVVPVLARGIDPSRVLEHAMIMLKECGSHVCPGCDNPEGVVLYHAASNSLFKWTFDGDGHKGDDRV